MFCWLSVVCVCCLVPELSTLYLIQVTAPEYVVEGEGAELVCDYQPTPGQFIDSIKWYLNSSEIYRIVPSLTTDRVLTFPQPGLKVDLHRSGLLRAGSHRLVLTRITRHGQGRYVCQVTESSPPFNTMERGLVIKTLAFPTKHLLVSNLEKEYHQGSQLRSLCVTPPVYPKPKVQWFINNIKLNEMISTECKVVQPNSLWTCSSHLTLTVPPPAVKTSLERRLTLTCSMVLLPGITYNATKESILVSSSGPLEEPLTSNSYLIYNIHIFIFNQLLILIMFML